MHDVCLRACAEQGSDGRSKTPGAASACAVGALLLLVGGAARADEEGFSQGPDVLSLGGSFLGPHQFCLTRDQQTALSV